MAAFKDKERGTWYVQFRYTDWRGERQQKLKRGFLTKREALEWERSFLMEKNADLDMSFESFAKLYEKDMKPKLKLSTWVTKENIIRTKILPYFRLRKLSEISAKDILAWQNEMRTLTDENGKCFSETYLKTIHNQMSAIFNHAVRYYNLRENPCRKAGSMGKKRAKEMLFWTKDEYLKFADEMMDKPISYYAFEILYWCGIREGELLALTPKDFDFQNNLLHITKTYNKLQGQEVITLPKTDKSYRTIKMPQIIADEMQDYFKMLYGLEDDARIFPLSKSYLCKEMDRGSKSAEVKRIRVHDLRHSAVSLLIDLGFSVVAIADRMGHESAYITLNYAHLFPSKQAEMADRLDKERRGYLVSEES